MSGKKGEDDLLSLGDIILLFIYRQGGFEGTKAGLADKLGYDATWVGRKIDDLETQGLIVPFEDKLGYKVTKNGRVRLRPFIVPRLSLAFALAVAVFVVTDGIGNLIFGITISVLGLVSVGVLFLVFCSIALYYQLSAENRLLSRKLPLKSS